MIGSGVIFRGPSLGPPCLLYLDTLYVIKAKTHTQTNMTEPHRQSDLHIHAQTRHYTPTDTQMYV